MKEYWVNVYEPIHIDNEPKIYGCSWETLEECKIRNHLGGRDNSYRIHVKIKDNNIWPETWQSK